MYRHSFPIVRYFNGILFVFTLVFLKCAHYSTDFGTRMYYLLSTRLIQNGGFLLVHRDIRSVVVLRGGKECGFTVIGGTNAILLKRVTHADKS